MFLFFDVESTGLPKDWKAPMTDLDNWPRVIELSFILCDHEGNEIESKTRIIYADCWEVPTEPFWVEHGFSTEKCKREGVPIRTALSEFIESLNKADYLVSHNLDFDHKVLGAEMLRYEMRGKKVAKICTKEVSTEYCKIHFGGQRAWLSKAQGRYKWPKLSELHQKLFGKDFESAHSAGGDVAALKACFFELLRIGIINLEPITTQP